MIKYINAEKLKAEIERRIYEDYSSRDLELDEVAQGVCASLLTYIDSLQQEQQMKIEEEITNTTRACCNCLNATVRYPSCYCWQHKHCNTDDAYKIPKGLWLETAKDCEAFELDNN